jgi:hypothetical protein
MRPKCEGVGRHVEGQQLARLGIQPQRLCEAGHHVRVSLVHAFECQLLVAEAGQQGEWPLPPHRLKLGRRHSPLQGPIHGSAGVPAATQPMMH